MPQAICTVPSETLQSIRKFRLTPLNSKATTIPTNIYKIDPKTTTLVLDESLKLDSLEELGDELPDNSPRFLLMNYGYTSSKEDRFISPLVGLYWRPETARGELKMLYAGAVELFRMDAGCNMWLECTDEEDIPGLKNEIEN